MRLTIEEFCDKHNACKEGGDFALENYATIVTGTLNILEAVKVNSPNTKVFILFCCIL